MPVLHTVANTKSFSRGSQTHFSYSCSDQNAHKVKGCHFYCGHISAVFTMLSSAVFRYKPLCPDTWPNWKGTAAEGVRRLIKHLGYKSDEYKMGRYADINGWVTQSSSSKSFSTEALLNKEKSSNLDRHSAFVLPMDTKCQGPLQKLLNAFIPQGQKSSSATREPCSQQKMPFRFPNTSLVSSSVNKATLNTKVEANGETVSVIAAATRIQAKYKGYRVKGDYLKQREAGEC